MSAQIIELFTGREPPRRRNITTALVELLAQCVEEDDDFAFAAINDAWARIEIHRSELKRTGGDQ
ncbi:hypothetical protein [Asticcacaulis taihuensis]|uniref:hypothetical protein n=1 Tax=Asticcacaulis taihuensis TaxID=260084 RepID=UPI0026F0B3FD|nr:hypothetical protein [Asticcacaulis taihuensis]